MTIIGKHLRFSGRASRKDYWTIVGPLLALLSVAFAYDVFVAGPTEFTRVEVREDLTTGERTRIVTTGERYGARTLTLVVFYASLVPFTIALSRRVCDIGYPAWYALTAIFFAFFALDTIERVLMASGFGPAFVDAPRAIAIFGLGFVALAFAVVSFVALFVIFMWGIAPSQPRPNRYGPNPNEVTP